MRRPIIAGNWKMYKTPAESEQFVSELKPLLAETSGCEVVLCPPFTSLNVMGKALEGSGISLGAQNMHWEPQGAYTGEISAAMLKACGCKYVILGHSERREYFKESDQTINRKIKAALQAGLVPIFCVGEKLAQREAGETFEVIKTQLSGGLQGLSGEETGGLIVAYEPVWAIGTGKTASSKDAEEVISFIRNEIAGQFGQSAADSLRIQYGGSVKPENTAELMKMPNIDGALVGGASLDPTSFAAIVKNSL